MRICNVFFSIYSQTDDYDDRSNYDTFDANQPEINVDWSQNVADHNLSNNSISWNDGRWASPNRENSQPHIIGGGEGGQSTTSTPRNVHSIFNRNNILNKSHITQPLNVEITNTYEQDDLELLIGNIREYIINFLFNNFFIFKF